jgi:hypothetical protein
VRRLAAIVCLALASSAVPAAAAGPFQFHAITPCRAFNTRTSHPPALSNSVARNVNIQGVCGIPTTATAVTLNATIVAPTGDGHLTLWPSGTSIPVVSTLNFRAGEPALANGAIVPLADNAPDLSIQSLVCAPGNCNPGNGQTVDVIIDVTGYFE